METSLMALVAVSTRLVHSMFICPGSAPFFTSMLVAGPETRAWDLSERLEVLGLTVPELLLMTVAGLAMWKVTSGETSLRS